MSIDFASVLTKNRGYIGPMRVSSRRLLAAFTAFALTAVSAAVSAQTTPADKPAVKPVRSIPYVSITGDDGRQRHYETNAIPLLFNRACFNYPTLGDLYKYAAYDAILQKHKPTSI